MNEHEVDVQEALTTLKAPLEIRRFLTETKCDAAPALLNEALKWLNTQFGYVKEEYKRQKRYMGICLEAMKKETALIEQGNGLLKPKQGITNKIPIAQAQEAITQFYCAGYASAVKELYMVSQKEQQDLNLKSEACRFLSQHIEDLQYTFSVDKNGCMKEMPNAFLTINGNTKAPKVCEIRLAGLSAKKREGLQIGFCPSCGARLEQGICTNQNCSDFGNAIVYRGI